MACCSVLFVTVVQQKLNLGRSIDIASSCILVLAQIVNVLASQFNAYLVMAGKAADSMKITTACLIVTCIASFLLDRTYGAMGAALAVFAGMGVKALYSIVVYKNNMDTESKVPV